MKKMYVVLSVLVFVISSLQADFSYRLAVHGDVDQICELYGQFTEDDINKLVVFSAETQQEIISENIRRKRFFVACNDMGKIVSFLKLYVVDQEEIDGILHDELNLGVEQELLLNTCYVLPVEDVMNSNNLLEFHQIDPNQVIYSLLVSETQKRIRSNREKSCLYVYYGSAYTRSDYRGNGINTELQRVAMRSIQGGFRGNRFVVLLYGQVNANANSYGMIRVFAKSVAKVFPQQLNDKIVLHHLRCRAYIPDFDAEGNLQMVYDTEHEGYGNMVIYQVKGK